MQLVLSLFSGIGLLDQAFREKGFCVVSAGDLITGQDIRNFKSVSGKFNGVIGGSPCQDFSTLKRNRGDYSLKMLDEFIRVVIESDPDWWLLENVKGVPNVEIENYSHQRIDINQGWYSDTSRLRHIQFGTKNDLYLDISRGNMDRVKYSCALANDKRSFRDLCYLQGLSDDYDLPDFNVSGKKRAVGNGVPLVLGRVLANEVLRVTQQEQNNVTHLEENSVTLQHNKSVTQQEESNVTLQHNKSVTHRLCKNLCSCGCYRPVFGRKVYYDSSCRKRAQRNRLKEKHEKRD